ncbi:MAG: citrate lyase holo-[Synergistaceae bacterium]|nr:citrate lyase holo-[acyl-carrier protein] synthase [Synergistaceae bacterium]MBQ9594477.1 citrate lyase holo-[acyl-carrier protein] synthase [Synergistaceae bacterium]
MTGNEINLEQMLARREVRAREQQIFLAKYNSPLISFSMNIPGPIKTNELIRRAFDIGEILLLDSLAKIHAEILDFRETHEDTGDELLLAVKSTPETLKDIAVNIEETSPIGRVFDIDVIDQQGNKLSRGTFRKCLICGKQAQECARSRNHSVQEMQQAIEELLS